MSVEHPGMKVSITAMAAIVTISIFLFGGCAKQATVIADTTFMLASVIKPPEGEEVAQVLDAIKQRNATLEANTTWRASAYRRFLIKELADLDERDYAAYRNYLDQGDLYVIIHPAYYAFFDAESSSFLEPFPGEAQLNALQQFLQSQVFSSKGRLMQAQERMLRDFLEYASTAKKLVLLVLPGDYGEASSYRYGDGRDEYMRYINEVTNESESVLYLFSRRTTSGGLKPADKKRLLKFLAAVSPRKVLVGGGYLGRCVGEFWKDICDGYPPDNLYLVPEISAWSPADVTSDDASALLRSDGTLDLEKFSAAAEKKNLKTQKPDQPVKNLSRDAK
ncbi:MAG: hypothetical protein C0402_11235 [Thermodesulfovibrio sp.]|nr:hypothetical protein [Thermodesulfovibrio sp.]